MRFNLNGKLWVRKSYTEWAEECRMSRASAAKMIKDLADRGIIERRSVCINGKLLLIRFKDGVLPGIIDKYGLLENTEETTSKTNISEGKNVRNQSPVTGLPKSSDWTTKVQSLDFLYTQRTSTENYSENLERKKELGDLNSGEIIKISQSKEASEPEISENFEELKKTIKHGSRILGNMYGVAATQKMEKALEGAIAVGGLGYKLFEILQQVKYEPSVNFDLGNWCKFSYNIHPGSKDDTYRVELEMYLGELALNTKLDLELRLRILGLREYKLHARSSMGVLLDTFDILNIFDSSETEGLTDSLVSLFESEVEDFYTHELERIHLTPKDGEGRRINKTINIPDRSDLVAYMKRMARLEPYDMFLSDVQDSKIRFELLSSLHPYLDVNQAIQNLNNIPENMHLVVLDYTVRILKHSKHFTKHLEEFDTFQTFDNCKFAA